MLAFHLEKNSSRVMRNSESRGAQWITPLYMALGPPALTLPDWRRWVRKLAKVASVRLVLCRPCSLIQEGADHGRDSAPSQNRSYRWLVHPNTESGECQG